MADTSADTRGFIAHRPPFDTLPENVLDRVVGQLGRFELKAGDVFPPGDEDERTHLFIVQRGSIEMRTPSGRLCEKLGEGDLFTTQCQLVNLTEAETGTVMEKTVVLALRCTDLRTVCRESKEFAQHFRDSVTTRLRAAVDRNNQAMDAVADSLGSDIGDLVRHDPITLEASATIQQAARLMTDQRVSSVMIVDGGELAGLITDRDLRRSIASGLAHEDPVANIMTRDLKCISSGEPVMQALMVMTQLGVHHLPVMDGKRLIGMVTATDLTRHQSTHSALFASDVRKAASIGDLVRVSRKLPELQLHLANAGASALNIGEAVSFITDSLTVRLIEMAEDKLGAAPVAYCWVSGGSQARREQSSHSDQDNGLVVSDDMQPEHDEYFLNLARFVSDGLNACGFVYCPGDIMATNERWRQPVRTWKKYFQSWIESPDPEALMWATVFFDLRPVHGDMAMFEEIKNDMLERAQKSSIFAAYMAANALRNKPPLGFFRQFVLVSGGDHDDTLDIKHRGIAPITDLARVYALTNGLAEVNTVERLRAAAGIKKMNAEMADSLEDALEFIAQLRIRHQAMQIRAGRKADNYVPPGELSRLQRDQLKDAFKLIQTVQEAMSTRYQTSRFG